MASQRKRGRDSPASAEKRGKRFCDFVSRSSDTDGASSPALSQSSNGTDGETPSCMLNLSCCSILLPPVEYGSSPRYLTLKSFTDYIERSTFFPLCGCEEITVNVNIEKKTLEPGVAGCCSTCLSLINSTNLIEKVRLFNWIEIASMDLAQLANMEHWDPAFRRLATSVRDVRAFGFENGLAKILLLELVNLVRQLLCATHDLRLTMYV